MPLVTYDVLAIRTTPLKPGQSSRLSVHTPAVSSKCWLLQLEELATKLASSLQEKQLKGRTLTLKLKATNFEVR